MPRKGQKLEKWAISRETIRQGLARIFENQKAAFFALQYGVGARLGEVFNIRTDAVEVKANDEGTAYLWVDIPTEKNPLKPLRAFAINCQKYPWLSEPILKQHDLQVDLECDYLFRNKAGRKLFSDRSVERWTKKFYGLDIHNHLLRHSRITHFVQDNRNATIEVLMVRFGWASPRYASTYLHLRHEDDLGVFE